VFRFKLEDDLSLLTVTRTGLWSLETVKAYELALRRQLLDLHAFGRPTLFIIDIRGSGAQPRSVADALRLMVKGLGPLHADRTAVVTSSGIAKLQARRVADLNAQVFTSMALARDWVLGFVDPNRKIGIVHDVPSNAEAEGMVVHIQGPSDVDLMLTPAAALETAKRVGNAAVEALLAAAPRREDASELAA